MKIQFYKTETTYQGKVYKILTPTTPLTETYAGFARATSIIFANKADFMQLAALFALLTEIKDVIIYLSIRKNTDNYLSETYFDTTNFTDIVICHHSLQLKRGLFKQLKQRLSKRNLISFEVDQMKFADLKFDEKFWYKENKDLLDVAIQDDTLFLVGSSKVFGHLARECLQFRFDNYLPLYHDHTHLYPYLRNGVAVSEDMQFCFYDKMWWQKWLAEQEEV